MRPTIFKITTANSVTHTVMEWHVNTLQKAIKIVQQKYKFKPTIINVNRN